MGMFTDLRKQDAHKLTEQPAPARRKRERAGLPSRPEKPLPADEASTARWTRTPVRPVRAMRRVMTRHAFEIYHDQIDTLRELSSEDRRNGELGSMSQMVREGIDLYIAKRERGKK